MLSCPCLQEACDYGAEIADVISKCWFQKIQLLICFCLTTKNHRHAFHTGLGSLIPPVPELRVDSQIIRGPVGSQGYLIQNQMGTYSSRMFPECFAMLDSILSAGNTVGNQAGQQHSVLMKFTCFYFPQKTPLIFLRTEGLWQLSAVYRLTDW